MNYGGLGLPLRHEFKLHMQHPSSPQHGGEGVGISSDIMRSKIETYYGWNSIHLGMRIRSLRFLQSLGAQLDFSRKGLYTCICVPFSPESLGFETLILRIHGRLNDVLTGSVDGVAFLTCAAPPPDCVISWIPPVTYRSCSPIRSLALVLSSIWSSASASSPLASRPSL
jgi:hypothetical protein